MITAQASSETYLSEEQIRETLHQGLAGKYTNARVLVLIPDRTRTLPLSLLFKMIVEILSDTRQLDFMVALGTHPPLDEQQLHELVGITENPEAYRHVRLLNHAWDNPDALQEIGILSQEQIQSFAGEHWHSSLGGDMPIKINRRIFDYDGIIILGPTFPHEVVGFSGGVKYLFPGISGGEIIHLTHWLSALITVMDTIGIKDTPMRRIIHAAAECVPTPVTLVSLVVVKDQLAGMFIGDHISAWGAAADLSAERHIKWVEKPFKRVLSHAAPMYDELWTAAKAMYKLEPAVADSGELIIYSPVLDKVSLTHGKYIYQTGYHVRDYFLKQWDKFKDIPLSAIAHSTQARGTGTFENGIEKPRIAVTLATRISPEDCATLALGYINPDEINPAEWQNREDEGILYVPKAGEILYRLRNA